jgi:biotin carboxyl carrier protein
VQYEVEVNGRLRQVHVHRVAGLLQIALDGQPFTVDATRIDGHVLSLLIGHCSHEVTLATDAAGQTTVAVGGVPVPVALNNRRRWGRKDAAGSGGNGPQRLTAPMPGKVVRVLVAAGDAVTARQPLVVIEAMKMENELRALRDGIVADVQAREGQLVDAGALLLVVTPAAPASSS